MLFHFKDILQHFMVSFFDVTKMIIEIFYFQEKAAWEQINGVSVEELKRLSMESLDGGKKKKSGGLSGVSFRMGR